MRFSNFSLLFLAVSGTITAEVKQAYEQKLKDLMLRYIYKMKTENLINEKDFGKLANYF